jgi:hypothetical protein
LNDYRNTVFLSTAYFPPIEYFYLLQRFENAVIEAEETYPKQTYRNRCVIYSEKGSLTLTAPVIKTFGNQTKTKDIELFNEGRWQKNQWRAIYSAYQNSPYFLYYQDELEIFFTKKAANLLNWNLEITKTLCQLIGIKTELSSSVEFVKPGSLQNDHRFDISPKTPSLHTNFPKYTQVFSDRNGFIENLSILDLLFNLGPDTLAYLKKMGS